MLKTRSKVKEPWASLDYWEDMTVSHRRFVRVILDIKVRTAVEGHTSTVRLSSPSNLTMGWPPDSFSTRFWGRNRATTLMVFPLDIVALEMVRSKWL
jgi:hypothetical protein